jgi:hypothetical protein
MDRSRLPQQLRTLGAALLLLGAGACASDSWEEIHWQLPQAAEPASFLRDVQPILAASCNLPACHDGSNSSVSTLSTYAQVLPWAPQLRDYVQSGYMPPNEDLSPAQIQTLSDWVSQGALNN